MHILNFKRSIRQIICILAFIIMLSPTQIMYVSAESDMSVYNTNAADDANNNLLYPYRNIYLNQMYNTAMTNHAQSKANAAAAANTGSAITFESLGLNKINLSDLSKYVKIEGITKEQFYDMNFSLKIASVSLTTNDELLIRTINYHLHILHMAK